MKSLDLQFFKELLLSQRADILNKTDAFRAESVETTAQGDEGDLAVSEVALSLSLRLQERQTQHLQKIDRSLAKIEEGSFGLCEQCEEELISKACTPERLFQWNEEFCVDYPIEYQAECDKWKL